MESNNKSLQQIYNAIVNFGKSASGKDIVPVNGPGAANSSGTWLQKIANAIKSLSVSAGGATDYATNEEIDSLFTGGGGGSGASASGDESSGA